ncbi:MAG: DNA glycosylase AlkZ-like family protein [Sporichthyaceae bacterium]
MSISVSWDQVHTWRLRRQFVADPTGAGPSAIAARLCGVQAQVASCADLALRLRQVDPSGGGAASALAEGGLIKTWAMRGTLHLFDPRDAGNYLALIAQARTWEKPAWQRAMGLTPPQMEALCDALAELVTGTPHTRDELVAALAGRREFRGLEERLRSGWGSVLKPAAWRGLLCHGPSKGTRVTFTSPTRAPGWAGLPDVEQAAPAAITAYLGAYGPASPKTFDSWLTGGGSGIPKVRGWFAALGEKITAVDVEGRPGYLCAEHVDELLATTPSRSVHLLGGFDDYVLGPGTGDPTLLAAEHRVLVSRAAGWISPIVVVDGRIGGVWEALGGDIDLRLFPGTRRLTKKELTPALDRLRRARD